MSPLLLLNAGGRGERRRRGEEGERNEGCGEGGALGRQLGGNGEGESEREGETERENLQSGSCAAAAKCSSKSHRIRNMGN